MNSITNMNNSETKLHVLQRRLHNDEFRMRNHLLSIVFDSERVEEIRKLFPNILCFGNLRCGVWYAEEWAETCYFKSTDGHFRQLNFSLSRLNLNVAIKACQGNLGCMIFDSTRGSKLFPDSLQYTVPIWCAVLNRIIFNSTEVYSYFSPWTPDSLRSVLTSRVITLVESLPDSIKSLIQSNLQGSEYPFRPLWVCFDEDGVAEWHGDGADEFLSNRFSDDNSPLDFIPIILVSVSTNINSNNHRERHSWHYIKGAADDEENWSLGLTSQIFWRFKDEILSTDDPTEMERITAFYLQNQQPQPQPQSASLTSTEVGLNGVPMDRKLPVYQLQPLRETNIYLMICDNVGRPGVLEACKNIKNIQRILFLTSSPSSVAEVNPFTEGSEESTTTLGCPQVPHITELALTMEKRSMSSSFWTGTAFPIALNGFQEFQCQLSQSLASSEFEKFIIVVDDMSLIPAGVTIIAAIAVAFFDFDLNLRTEPRKCPTKNDIKTALSTIQTVLSLDCNSMPPRRLVKELSLFFVAPSSPWHSSSSLLIQL